MCWLDYATSQGMVSPHDKIDAMEPSDTGNIPSEMLYVEVGGNCGENSGGYKK